MKPGLILSILAITALTACAGGDRGLRDFDRGEGPDEFSVIPMQPLTLPDNLGALPPPTPGAGNRVDPNPTGDAIAALGGRPGAGVAGDAALLGAVGRNGVDPTIRADLAEADAQFRRNRARLGLFNRGDRYFQAYAGQALDAYAELVRFRNLGVAVPSAPPAE